jgi:hypothetical protein
VPGLSFRLPPGLRFCPLDTPSLSAVDYLRGSYPCRVLPPRPSPTRILPLASNHSGSAFEIVITARLVLGKLAAPDLAERLFSAARVPVFP